MMRVRIQIVFGTELRPEPEMRRILAAAGLTRLASPTSRLPVVFAESFLVDDPRLARLRHTLSDEHIAWYERRQHVYDEDDLQSAPLVLLSIVRAPKGAGGPTYGTEYDLRSGCSKCGSGSEQISALYLKASDLPSKAPIVETMHGDIVVSTDIARQLEAVMSAGLELRQTRSHIDHRLLPWWQLLPAVTMPRMSLSTSGIEMGDQCPACRRDGHFDHLFQPLMIAYAHDDIATPDALPDAAITWERFGLSVLKDPFTESNIAPAKLLVKPSIYHVLRQIRGVTFDLVSIV
ncbi:MAG TPA: hypothetical protein VMM78_00925 [Thermomicrobiales bacterium]|nr:hypothetical protein [Thermomicrobiales bacterium]